MVRMYLLIISYTHGGYDEHEKTARLVSPGQGRSKRFFCRVQCGAGAFECGLDSSQTYGSGVVKKRSLTLIGLASHPPLAHESSS